MTLAEAVLILYAHNTLFASLLLIAKDRWFN